ncbi:MAG: DUF2934 domain-containing protein [Gammaproteobacteria bacterium]|nr:DUF2934 domain-containing protein [Gammaproteobacteria bacterium]NIR83954.1 DUF2934 domain-containing protein [Gammaproteobacteria bacterium]NIR88997.1 DUF2934 domain-containing protein [Gammaproteobacteria bacterium]NIV74550.1 DUF2934 domain-containing protein [Gammaproteobacteria bacterium]
MATKKTPTEKAKAGAPNTGVRKKTRVRKTAARRSVTTAPIEVTPEERWRMIAVAAYHKAEQRNFSAGREIDDWLEAEKEIDALLGA